MKESSKKEPRFFKEIDEIFASHGILSEGLISYAVRPGQIDMAYLVAEALEDNRFLVVEAGTGTGKTLAYLIPSILWAVSNDDRVVISTNTINLQDQIWNFDIPLLQDILPYDFSAVQVKGRSNYLCLRKWSFGFQLTLDNLHSRHFADKIENWLRSTTSGDKSELNLSSLEDTIWRQFSADDYSCQGSRCRHSSDCFLRKVRNSAGKANLILVNHSLLLTDAAGSFGILPRFSKLVIDEAHNLSGAAVNQFSLSLEQGELFEIYNLLGQMTEKVKLDHLLGNHQDIQQQLQIIDDERSSLFRIGTEMFDYLQKLYQAGSGEKPQVRIRPEIEDDFCDSFVSPCSVLLKSLSAVEGAMFEINSFAEEFRFSETVEQINFAINFTRKKLAGLVQQNPDEYVLWVEKFSKGVCLNSAPLHAGDLLSEILYPDLDTVVFTSGTLRLKNSFDFFSGELGLSGLEDVIFERVVPAFDLSKQARIMIAEDLPFPKWDQDTIYIEACTGAISEIVAACTGNSLALFTSHRQLLQTYERLKEPLEQEGIRVLAHDIDGDRYHLVKELKSGGKTLLLGTGSFWEGIDVPGDSLQCVIITKLPFPVPDSPLLEAKIELYREMGKNPFTGIFLPVCTVRLLQGIGRLIRSEEDFGFSVILDSRLVSKTYGEFILESLPQVPVICGGVDQICESVKEMISARTLNKTK